MIWLESLGRAIAVKFLSKLDHLLPAMEHPLPQRVELMSRALPLSEGWCADVRPVAFNMSFGYVRHTDDGSVCDDPIPPR